jgi:general stress protein YciG
MAGTKEGSKKATKTITDRYGSDFFRRIGSKGGQVRRPETRAFSTNRDLARRAGAMGGRKSKRGVSESTNV